MFLADNRPAHGPLRCAVCGRPIYEYSVTGLHSGGIDTILSGEGLIVLRAECHGQFCDVLIPFSVAREREGKTVELFGDLPLIDGKPYDIPAEFLRCTDPETGARCSIEGRPLSAAEIEQYDKMALPGQ